MLKSRTSNARSQLKMQLTEALAPLRSEALAHRGGTALARRIAAVYDRAVVAEVAPALDAWRADGGRGEVALVAVGGYGRSTLGFGSDLDLVVLCDARAAAHAEALSERLLYPLWDAGVAVGHKLATVDELVALARDDLRTATMMLDARYLAGDAALAERALGRGLRWAFDGDLGRFIDALQHEMTERHDRFGTTVYLLEPDLKQGRGGLRDLDIARWALHARFHTPGFADALRAGALSEAERRALVEATECAWAMRLVLHAGRMRRVDRLTFDAQAELVAGTLDPALEPDTEAHGAALSAAIEQALSRWYRHAREASTVIEQLLPRCRPGRGSEFPHLHRAVSLGPNVLRFDGAACLAAADTLARDPVAALRLVEVALATGLTLGASSRASIVAASLDPRWCEALRRDPAAGPSFLRLLTHSGRAVLRRPPSRPISSTPDNRESVMAELHDLGLLLAMVPEFSAVTAKVQHDVYHVYTVDVHSVAALDRLHAIGRAEMPEPFALATALLPDTDRRDVLCLATLLHDIGKNHGRAHAVVGAELAPAIALRLGLGADDAATVAWLVADHLTLYHLATRRDASDPVTLKQLEGATGGDPWRLRALYLLTVADLSTTSPTALNAWKSRMLEDLYLQADRAHRGAPPETRREALVAQALGATHDPAEAVLVGRFVAAMPARYLRATAPEAVRRHAGLWAALRPEGDLSLRPLQGRGVDALVEVVVRAPDRRGLLATIAGLLFAHRLDVQGAEIHGRAGEVFDVFVARLPDACDDPRARAALAERLRAQFAQCLDGALDVDALVRARRRAPGFVRPEPTVRVELKSSREASDEATVFEVFGPDRPGFLYAVARSITEAGVEIRVAKVNTEGRRAADVFYGVNSEGEKLTLAHEAQVRAAIEAGLDALLRAAVM